MGQSLCSKLEIEKDQMNNSIDNSMNESQDNNPSDFTSNIIISSISSRENEANDSIIPEKSSYSIDAKSISCADSSGHMSLTKPKASEAQKSTIYEPSVAKLVEDNSKLRIKLMPHEHTLFCERKERVCGSVGKLMERELLKVKGISEPLAGCVWKRSPVDYLPPSTDDSTHDSYDPSIFTNIVGSENMTHYHLSADDVGRFILFEHCWRDSATGQTLFVQSTNILGPVLPGPPRLLDLTIEGNDFSPNHYVYAQSEYIGGTEGPSEFWWFQIKDGKRSQLGEPIAVSHLDIASDPSLWDTSKDPRVYLIKESDVGSVLKVKCRPVRVDGYKGEVFTSKASVNIHK